jgi:hypothetical protein
MKVPRLATQSLNRWLARNHRHKMASLIAAIAALCAALSGCQSQQTNPGDPFLPFMRTRVPPPGTAAPADPYYPGAPMTTAPPAVSGPPPVTAPAAAPMSMPASTPLPPNDKYSPRGGFNLPQSSIDRSKAIDPATGELKAGGTAIARRSRPKPVAGRAADDAQLAAAPAAAIGATLASSQSSGSAGEDPATNDETEQSSDQSSSGAASLAFADEPQTSGADAVESTDADRRNLVATAGRWSSGSSEMTPSASASTLRIVGSDDAGSAEAGAVETSGPDNGALATTSEPSSPLQSSLIESDVPADQTAVLAMADSTAGVVQASWNETSQATSTSVARANSASGANQLYGYDPAYGWLHGRLEYSASQRVWKVRYIPIDGATDQFGGSVVLADGVQTQGLKVGDFVTAEGRVVAASQSSRGFSPRYEVVSIKAASTN